MEPRAEVLKVANSFPAWILNMALVAIVFVQAAVFARLAFRYSKSLGVSAADIKKAFKTGIVATVGPAVAIFIAGFGLMSQIGAPLTVARLSVIGNAMYETYAAQMGAAAAGTSLGQANYGPEAFAASAWTMAIGADLMLIMPLVLAKPFSAVKEKLENRNKELGKVIGLGAALGAFGYAVVGNVATSRPYAVASITSFVVMFTLLRISTALHQQWLREWALGIAMLCGMFAATVLKG